MLRLLKSTIAGVWILFSLPGCQEDTKTVLVAVDFSPAESPTGNATELLAAAVSEQSDGAIEFEIHHDVELLSPDEIFRGIQSGVADIGLYILNAEDGFKLSTAASLPFIGWPDIREATQLYDKLMAEFPQMAGEWQNLTILAMFMMPGTHMHFKDIQVTVPEDLDGVRVLGAEAMTAAAMEAAGAIPLALSVAEWENALDAGTADGIIIHLPAMPPEFADKLNYHLLFGDGGINMTPAFLIANSNVWNNLNDKHRTLIITNARNVWRESLLTVTEELEITRKQEIVDSGVTVRELTMAEIAGWREEIAQPVHYEWIAIAEANGLPGQQVYNRILQLVSQDSK